MRGGDREQTVFDAIDSVVDLSLTAAADSLDALELFIAAFEAGEIDRRALKKLKRDLVSVKARQRACAAEWAHLREAVMAGRSA